MKNSHLSESKFSEFDLPAPVLEGLQTAGFEYCTEIQSLTLPHVLAGKDVAGQAQTGTGKTAAFLVGTFAKLVKQTKPSEDKKDIRCLILAPTRELAIQIHSDAKVLGGDKYLKLGLAYGGVDYEKQRTQIDAGVDILIGTPGRVIDYFKQGVFSLKHCEVLVLDEADRMFDLGFIADIRYLLRRCPPPAERLSLLFSATLSHRVLELAYEHMNEPVNVSQDVESVTARNITETLYLPAQDEKLPLLAGLIKRYNPERAMVFVNTKHVAEKVQRTLEHNGFSVDMLSGDVRQSKRQTILKQFQRGDLKILVATDVAARGLHIDGVSHVFNYDLPQNAEDYVHRIGRTARAGASGDAISFACEEYAIYQMDIEEYIERRIPSTPIESDMLLELERPPRKPQRDKEPRGRKPSGNRSDRPRHEAPTSEATATDAPKRRRRRKPKREQEGATEQVAAESPQNRERRGGGRNPYRRNRNRKPRNTEQTQQAPATPTPQPEPSWLQRLIRSVKTLFGGKSQD